MHSKLFKSTEPIIGMVHLLALPGSPGWSGDISNVISSAKTDASKLTEGGVNGILFENFGDAPFLKDRITPLTISYMTKVILKCVNNLEIPFGVNVLRNDWEAALSIASAIGASFIRVNVLSGVYATDQGIIEGKAYQCLQLRKIIKQDLGHRIEIYADVETKHGTPLHDHGLESATRDLIERVGVDGIIVTGSRTGEPPLRSELESVNKFSGNIPIFVGSGVNEKNINDYQKLANGFIVGTGLKFDGKVTNQVDVNKVKNLVEILKL